MDIGAVIKKLRKKNKVTQVELAEALKIADNTVSQYEHGRVLPSDKIKLKIADYFGVSIDYLMGREEDFDGLNIITEPYKSKKKSEIQELYDSLDEPEQDMLIGYGLHLKKLKSEIKKQAK